MRRISKVQATRLERSLARFGICAPILVDADGRIVHGNAVWEAAKRLGIETVPIVAITHLTPSQIRILRLALNRLAETGEWDEEALRIELVELVELGEDLVDTGFELAELDGLLLDEELPTSTQEAPLRLAAKAVSRPGDLWALGSHRLVQGDARDVEAHSRLFGPGETAGIVLTDVPFNVPNRGHVTRRPHAEFAMAHGEMSADAFAAFNEAWFKAALKHLAEGGLLAPRVAS